MRHVSASWMLLPLLILSEAACAAEHPRMYFNSAELPGLREKSKTTHLRQWSDLEAAAKCAIKSHPPAAFAGDGGGDDGDRIPQYALAYVISGKPEYCDLARRWLLGLCQWPQWSPEKDWYAKNWHRGTGHLLAGVSIGYDWLYNDLSESERDIVRHCVAQVANDMLKWSRGEYKVKYGNGVIFEAQGLQHNWAWVIYAGLGMAGIAFEGEIPEAAEWLAEAEAKFARIRAILPDDGSDYEGLGYGGYALGCMLKYYAALKTAKKKDLFAGTPWLRNAATFRLYCTMPDRVNGAAFSDAYGASSDSRDFQSPCFWLNKLAAEYHDGHAQWLSNAQREMWGKDYGLPGSQGHLAFEFIWFNPGVVPRHPGELPTVRHFEDLGLIIARSGWGINDSVFAFKCGPNGGHKGNTLVTEGAIRAGYNHAHPDMSSFELWAEGQRLVRDDGYALTKWTRQHNTITVGGLGQEGEGANGFTGENDKAYLPYDRCARILKFSRSDEWIYVLGDASRCYRGETGLTRFRRHVIVYPAEGTVVLFDELAAGKPTTFEWQVHTDGTVSRNEKRDAWDIRIGLAGLRLFALLPDHAPATVEPQTFALAGRQETVARVMLCNAEPAAATEFLTILSPTREGRPHGLVKAATSVEGTLRTIILTYTWGSRHPLTFRKTDGGYEFLGNARPKK